MEYDLANKITESAGEKRLVPAIFESKHSESFLKQYHHKNTFESTNSVVIESFHSLFLNVYICINFGAFFVLILESFIHIKLH